MSRSHYLPLWVPHGFLPESLPGTPPPAARPSAILGVNIHSNICDSLSNTKSLNPIFFSNSFLVPFKTLTAESIFNFAFKVHLLNWKAGLQKVGGRNRETFYPLIHSPNVLNSQSWTSLKVGARNFTKVSVSAGAQALGLSSNVFPGHQQGIGLEVVQSKLKPAFICYVGTHK